MNFETELYRIRCVLRSFTQVVAFMTKRSRDKPPELDFKVSRRVYYYSEEI
jgi:hypothetical protein